METAIKCPPCGHVEIGQIPFNICPKCGIVIAKYYARLNYKTETKVEKEKPDTPITCPKCNSAQLNSDKKGFGALKAIGGGLILGPVGLLAGFAGSKKIVLTCLKCGHQWQVTPQQ